MKTPNTMEVSEQEKWMLEKMRSHPPITEQVLGMLEEIDDEAGKLESADEAEEALVQRMRELGRLGLGRWARNKALESETRAPEQGARRDIKKKRAG